MHLNFLQAFNNVTIKNHKAFIANNEANQVHELS